ncbi:MAG: TIGR00296 family protein [Euryarchaeota archaeon]|nr:TIGR00296 family protein [Euryarchaeota archaeon]
MYSLEDGRYLVALARRAIEVYLREGRELEPPGDAPEKLRQKAGVFVTLERYPEHELRGCIGYPEPVYPLVEATIRAAISAATQDPRFPPVSPGELERCTVEVTVLTAPRLLEVESPRQYPEKVQVGRHGLIVERGLARGLLLPQVPVDHGWTAEEFLSHTCIKAGLMPDCWLEEGTKIYTFEGIVFAETSPGGEVRQRSLRSC